MKTSGSVARRVLRAMGEGTGWAVVLTLAVAALAAWGPWDRAFARRWDGGCTGWTTTLAATHATIDLGYWWAYVVVALVILRLHPVVESVPASRLTVRLMVGIFVGCGSTHLLSAYTALDPVYRFSAGWNGAWLVVSLVGTVFVATSLVRIFDTVLATRRRLEAAQRNQG